MTADLPAVTCKSPRAPSREGRSGEMAEWLKAHAWKACVRETVPWVRIPLSPPRYIAPLYPIVRIRRKTNKQRDEGCRGRFPQPTSAASKLPRQLCRLLLPLVDHVH